MHRTFSGQNKPQRQGFAVRTGLLLLKPLPHQAVNGINCFTPRQVNLADGPAQDIKLMFCNFQTSSIMNNQ